MDTKYDVFISYSRKDSKTAKEIFEALSNASISCFFDEKLNNPDVWEVLVNEIENCKVFLYLGSKNTASARITPKELAYAINHKDRSCIYPYFIDDYTLPKVHEFLLADINWRKMSTHPIDTGLIPDLKGILSGDYSQPNPSPLKDEVLQVAAGGQVFEMVRVEGGSLTIGATIEQMDYAESNEHPAHTVILPTYYIGRFPVTQNIWEAVMGYNKSHYAKKEGYLASMTLALQSEVEHGDINDSVNKILNMTIKDAATEVGKLAKGKAKSLLKSKLEKRFLHITDNKGHYPAERLTHDEALEFVRRLSQMTNIQFALPTEDEWEYAARGGQKSQGFRYAGNNNLEKVAWYKNNSEGSTHPVGE